MSGCNGRGPLYLTPSLTCSREATASQYILGPPDTVADDAVAGVLFWLGAWAGGAARLREEAARMGQGSRTEGAARAVARKMAPRGQEFRSFVRLSLGVSLVTHASNRARVIPV